MATVTATIAAEPASGPAAERPENRVKGFDVLSLPCVGVDVPFSPDCIREFPLHLRQIASAKPYAYVGGDPLNAADPTGRMSDSYPLWGGSVGDWRTCIYWIYACGSVRGWANDATTLANHWFGNPTIHGRNNGPWHAWRERNQGIVNNYRGADLGNSWRNSGMSNSVVPSVIYGWVRHGWVFQTWE